MTFAIRKITATITLGSGQFGETAGPSLTLTGLRMQCSIAQQIGDTQGAAILRIFGLPLSTINQLTTIGPIANQIRSKNSLQIAAGDDENGMSVIHEGTIDQAYGQFQAMPDCTLTVESLGALAAAVKPVNATSFKGATSVAVIMAQLAKLAGFGFENTENVQVQLADPYFDGAALTQISECALAAGIGHTIDKGVLAIWPRGSARYGTIPVLSKATGMDGYPTFSSDGIVVKTEFNPHVQAGGQVEIQSDLTAANAVWNVVKVAHDIASEMPGGPWFTVLTLQRGSS